MIVKEQDILLDTPQRYLSPDNVVKDISRKKEVFKSEDISSKKADSTIDNRLQVSKSKVELLGDKTTKVTPVERHTTRAESTAKELLRDQDISEKNTRTGVVGDTQTEFPKQTLHESDRSDVTVEEIQSKVVTIKDKRATVREPSVTDKTKPKLIEKKTTDYKTDSPENGRGATRKWETEVKQLYLKADVQYIPPQEVETISRKEGEVQGLQSVIATRILTLETEGKEHVSMRESSRGIEGKLLYVTEHVFLI